MKRFLIFLVVSAVGFLGIAAYVIYDVKNNLPRIISVEDYEPLLVTQVYDRNKKIIGEFFRERRTLVPYKKIQPMVINAFLAAEDAKFFTHKGVDYLALMRATLANFQAGGKAQGASTITMQVARSLMLTPEKTYIRKIKEIFLSHQMETHLSKEDILYLYLNQIYFGQGAYGIQVAAETYFRKNASEMTVPEIAILAGLPKAPTRYSPVVNPQRAKERQVYVLRRMAEEGYLSEEQATKYINENIKVYMRTNYKEVAPFYLETVRQLLVEKLGEEQVLDKGLKIYTGVDTEKQIAANEKVKEGLRVLDKRQGYRGAKQHLEDPSQIAEFLKKVRDKIIDDKTAFKIIKPDGTVDDYGPLVVVTSEMIKTKKYGPIPSYVDRDQIVEGIVTKVDDRLGLVYVRFAEGQGVIDFETMKWARKPNPSIPAWADEIKLASQALKTGDVIEVKVTGERVVPAEISKRFAKMKLAPEETSELGYYAKLLLEQEPQVEGALLSIDQASGDILAMVGGYDFKRSEYNRSIQAARQTGSSFKALVYASALDKGYTPASRIIDSPIVREEQIPKTNEDDASDDDTVTRKWKPLNHSKTFTGDILFRNALIRSLNVPSVKILEDIGINWAVDYARRLGLFNSLNMDLTLVLGSSSITLYEMTKAFAVFGHQGKRVKPILARRVESRDGKPIITDISLDARFEKELSEIEKNFEERRVAWLEKKAQEQAQYQTQGVVPPVEDKKHKTPRIFFEDPDQLIAPQSAYLITSILKGVVEERGGTGGAARALGREVAGKTGSSNNYYDAWFLGYTPQIVTGVWVGYDEEKSIGKGEVGGRSALPIWLEYMKEAHKNLPELSFPVPAGIVFANIDNENGKLASAATKEVVKQAFQEGTEPTESGPAQNADDEANFYKQDLSE